MKITNLDFNDSETAAIYALAGSTLMRRGHTREETLALVETLTPQNVLRLALSLETRKRGGARENTGPKKPLKKKRNRKGIDR